LRLDFSFIDFFKLIKSLKLTFKEDLSAIHSVYELNFILLIEK